MELVIVKQNTQPTCKCGRTFKRYSSFQDKCLECVIERVKKDRVRTDAKQAKAERKQRRAEKLRLKSKGDWLKEAQAEFNKWIRWRDRDLPCISCQRFHKGQWHASHYRSRGACPELRFEPLNCHKSCSACNEHLSGNIVEYRLNLIDKIGQDKVDWLERKDHPPKKYTIDEITEIKRHYQKLNRELLSGTDS